MTLWQVDLGNLGDIRIRKISDSRSDLSFNYPPYPNFLDISNIADAWIGQQMPREIFLNDTQRNQVWDEWKQKYYQEKFGEAIAGYWERKMGSLDKSALKEFLEEIVDFQKGKKSIQDTAILNKSTQEFFDHLREVHYKRRVDYKQRLLNRITVELENEGMILETEQTIGQSSGTIEQEKGQSEESIRLLDRYNPEMRALIDQACLGWAGRGYLPRINMDEYLSGFFKDKYLFLSTDEFKRALKNAGERGLIVKRNRRWRLP